MATLTVNGRPVTVADDYLMDEDGSLVVLVGDGVRANDSDVETARTSLVVTVASDVSSGTLALSSDGSFTYDPNA